MFSLARNASRGAIQSLCGVIALCALSACAEVQMGYNVLTYDTAIADTANQLLLLNAVRASEHYPKSFTSTGGLVAGPPVSGSIQGTWNFTTLAGLQNYSLNPSTTASAGYTQFALGNLNAQKFMVAMRAPVNEKITKAFNDDTTWPRQVLQLVYYQAFFPTEEVIRTVDASRKSLCLAPTNGFSTSFCNRLTEQIEEFTSNCNEHFVNVSVRIADFRNDRGIYYNSAVNYCHYNRFRIFLGELWLTRYPICLKRAPRCLLAKERSPLEMISYLGELIAAQNYIEKPFTPRVTYGGSASTSVDFVDVPLFVVIRGEAVEGAAVSVRHNGTNWFIPRPNFGSPREERSLQTLDLVLQTVQAATQQNDLPTTVPPVAVVKQ